MSQPVKLSDALLLDARLTASVAERSIAGQIEFWARLGRAVEPMLQGEKTLALRQLGDMQPLSAMIASVDSDRGRKRVVDFLQEQPFPHYEQLPGRTAELVRIDEDGTRTIGRFVNREFQPVDPRTPPSAGRSKTAAKPKKRQA